MIKLENNFCYEDDDPSELDEAFQVFVDYGLTDDGLMHLFVCEGYGFKAAHPELHVALEEARYYFNSEWVKTHNKDGSRRVKVAI